MELRKVGNSGLKVSRLGLGTLAWGRDTPKEEAHAQLELFLENGGNLVDTSSLYGSGAALNTLGEILQTGIPRHELIICDKAGAYADSGEVLVDNSRLRLLNALDNSLRTLGTDYVDIWLVDGRDISTPIEEVLSTLVYAVTSGKVRYLGVSDFPGWAMAQLATLLSGKDCKLAVSYNEFSLLNRSIEAEVIPAAIGLGMGIFANAPLAGGVLTGKYRATIPPDSRAASSHLAHTVEGYLAPPFNGIVESVATAASGLNRDPLEVALAWVRDTYPVACTIVGPRNEAQLAAIVASEDLVLPPQIRQVLSEVSVI